MTLQEVADFVKISNQAISEYEKGKSFPSLKHLAALADALDVSVDYLLGRTNNPDSHKTINI